MLQRGKKVLSPFCTYLNGQSNQSRVLMSPSTAGQAHEALRDNSRYKSRYNLEPL